ncbi:MAG: rhamnogalacturonan acetylesterase [Flectobacillus sp.]|uniref:rhamnogalacturonan acetylesterase n=1 Tax=Flectobacillus sp. TaxID=50419 RepID=UPI003B99702A
MFSQKSVLSLCLITAVNLTAFSQVKNSFKFDFGTGAVAKGFQAVGPSDYYSKAKGFGFMPNAKISAENRASKEALTADFCTSNTPFFFTVDVPEGNYDVKVILGDAEGTSSTSIKAECRRLMLAKVETEKGKLITKNFTVNVRYPEISDSSSVKLKPREKEYLHWDHQLTLEFNGKLPKVCALEITPASSKIPTVFLAGNSTVVDQAIEPFAAWGQMIPSFFQAGKVVFANHAESGETIKSFTSEKRLEKVMSQIKKGDYFFMEFAHNDQKPGSGLKSQSTYKEYLVSFIKKTREKGATPVLVTSMHRRKFDENGKIINTLEDFPDAMRQVAKDENVALIDLNKMSKTLWETLGIENSKKAFVHYEANTFPNQEKAIHDDTHFSNYGAYQLAKCIVEGIKSNHLGIEKYLNKDFKAYNPAQPDDLNTWDFPVSPLVSVIKPDGN